MLDVMASEMPCMAFRRLPDGRGTGAGGGRGTGVGTGHRAPEICVGLYFIFWGPFTKCAMHFSFSRGGTGSDVVRRAQRKLSVGFIIFCAARNT
jgi:hypothetical protein